MSFLLALQMRWLLVLPCLAHAGLTADEDPLAQWLSSLQFHLPPVTQTKAGITFQASNLACRSLTLAGIQSELKQVGLTITVAGIGIQCTGHFEFHGLGIVGGHGDVVASVAPGPQSHATLALSGTDMDYGVPWKAEVPSCDAKLKFNIILTGSAIVRVANLFTTTLAAYLQREVPKQACAQLREIAAANLTEKLADLNRFMLPPSLQRAQANRLVTAPSQSRLAGAGMKVQVSLASALEDVLRASWSPQNSPKPASLEVERRLGADEGNVGGSVDWTENKLLDWGNWFLEDILGVAGIHQAIRWALKNSSTATLPGPEFPVMNTSIQQPGAGIELQVQVFLKQVTLEGVESLRELKPLRAFGPNELEFGASLGTQEQPSVGVGVDIRARMQAVDTTRGIALASVEEELSLHLGLLEPSLKLNTEVLISEKESQKRKTVGQFFVGAEGCLKSLLIRPPLLKSLSLDFKDLADGGLTFESKTTGRLEAGISALLNNGVILFSQVYQKFLPGAVARAVGSPKCLSAVNKVLAAHVAPGVCIGAEEAWMRVRQALPEFYGNWPPIFGNFMRDAVDNLLDGFIAHNVTRVTKGLELMPSYSVKGIESVQLRELAFMGMDQVSHLRVLLPDEQEPGSLAMEAEVLCPTSAAPWSPELVVNGSLAAGAISGDGLVRLEAPCGTVRAKANVEVDLWSLMDMDVPPSLACALLSPLSKLDFTSVQRTFNGGGKLVVQPLLGTAQEPLKQLCQLHPKFCALGGVFAGSISDAGGATKVFHKLRNLTLSHCAGVQKTPPAAQPAGTAMRDSLGYSYHDPADSYIWIGSGVATLALALAYMLAAGLVQRMTGGVDCRTGASCSLATICMSKGTKTAQALTFGTSLLLATGLTLRILSSFWLPFASADVVAVQTQSGSEIIPQMALLEYTYFGIAQGFLDGGSMYCYLLWLLTSVSFSLAGNALLLLLWLTPAFASKREELLWLALLLGRFAFQELETLGNTAIALDSTIQLPLNMEGRVLLTFQAGAFVSLAASAFSVTTALWLLSLLPAGENPEKDWARGSGQRSLVAL
ncbi:unnamed protein product, partial [Polarella glacialis]